MSFLSALGGALGGPGGIALGSLASGLLGSKAGDRAAGRSKRQLAQTRRDLEPYMTAGTNALNTLGDFNIEDDPGYQFARDQALQATSRYMGGRGFGNSGNVLSALNDRATGVGRQYYDTAWNQQMGLAGLGQNTAMGLGNIGEGNVAQQNQANMFGAGSINNAIQGGIGNSMLYNWMNQNPYQGATTNSLSGSGGMYNNFLNDNYR